MVIDVIIPALNEEASVGKVLHAIPKDLVRRIYVCDNGSTDKTAENARAAGALVCHEARRGYGSACLKGISCILTGPPDEYPEVLVFLDADFSDDPSEMSLLIDAMQSRNLDLVIGSRVLGRREEGSLTTAQRFGNALSTWLIRWLFHQAYTDLGPFRAIRWEALIKMSMEDPDYGWTVEMQVKAAKLKMKTGEVPVSYRNRIGKSKVSGTIRGVIGAGSKILYIIFKSFVKG